MRLVVVTLLALTSVTLGGSCLNTGILNVGDIVTDGPGDYEPNLECTWEFGPAAAGTHIALAFTQLHVEGGFEWVCLNPNTMMDELCMTFPQEVGEVAIREEEYNGTFTLCSPFEESTTRAYFESDMFVEYAGFTARIVNVTADLCSNPIADPGSPVPLFNATDSNPFSVITQDNQNTGERISVNPNVLLGLSLVVSVLDLCYVSIKWDDAHDTPENLELAKSDICGNQFCLAIISFLMVFFSCVDFWGFRVTCGEGIVLSSFSAEGFLWWLFVTAVIICIPCSTENEEEHPDKDSVNAFCLMSYFLFHDISFLVYLCIVGVIWAVDLVVSLVSLIWEDRNLFLVAGIILAITVALIVLATFVGDERHSGSENTSELRMTSDKLVAAARQGDIGGVKRELNAGADVNKQDEDGRTALHWASFHGYTEIVELLLAKGADVHKPDQYGKTALDAADNDEIKALLRSPPPSRKRRSSRSKGKRRSSSLGKKLSSLASEFSSYKKERDTSRQKRRASYEKLKANLTETKKELSARKASHEKLKAELAAAKAELATKAELEDVKEDARSKALELEGMISANRQGISALERSMTNS